MKLQRGDLLYQAKMIELSYISKHCHWRNEVLNNEFNKK